jgi:exodeoxyribonuclease VII large subunit
MNHLFVPDNVKIHSVSDVSAGIKQLLEEGIPSVWVTGEITRVTVHQGSGHRYFSLKDKKAVIKAVMWRSDGVRLRFELREGLEVIVHGRLDVYTPHGEYKLVVDQIYPKGVGAQELALRQLKEKLLARGYFAPARKRVLPRFPQRIALVTSSTGAALRDMLEILGRRWPSAEVWLCPVRVQGNTAAGEIVAALRLVNRLPVIDVVIIGRGGGSAEDLGAFNDERVAEAIFESRLPVVSAVGHEIDVTIADLVADKRALTPSEAAELVTPDRAQLAIDLEAAWQRLGHLVGSCVRQARQRLGGLGERRVFQQPLERIRDLERRLEDWQDRLNRTIDQRLFRARQKVEAEAARLESLSPLNVLARGYSLTRRQTDQAVIRRADQVRPGETLVTYVQHGKLVSRVEETSETGDLRSNSGGRGSCRAGSAGASPSQAEVKPS